MKLISARKDFWSNNELAVTDAIRDVDLVGEIPSVPISESTFLTSLAGKKVLVLVHGYNNEPEDVHDAYAVLESYFARLVTGDTEYDQIVGYIWPGGDDPLDYGAAKKRANALARRFGIWLAKMQATRANIDVMGHSMGARVILKALKKIAEPAVRNTFLMAAAVDDESIQTDEEFYLSTQETENIFVFHSRHDGVLRHGYRFLEGDTALGLNGPEDPYEMLSYFNPADPETPNVFVVNCKNVIRKHGAYKRTVPIYTYLSAYLAGTVPRQYETL